MEMVVMRIGRVGVVDAQLVENGIDAAVRVIVERNPRASLVGVPGIADQNLGNQPARILAAAKQRGARRSAVFDSPNQTGQARIIQPS